MSEDSGGMIGPYRLLGVLGEGGMGRVYLAQEASPPRRVALKALRSAVLSGEHQQRFRREAELLAGLEHPNVAHLYASGVAETTGGPVPYLAMEYVQGSQLIVHAQQAGLSLARRAALLATIARAVHFAHSRGVVHRDLKPDNILVTAEGIPKVLDFGVAHVAGRDDLTQLTAAGEVLGTVPYMSREQLAGDLRQLDPRWDVYALGVIAYELLCGELPYAAVNARSTVIGALQAVLNNEPTPLSRKLPAARGDLETVVMKACAPDAKRRYGSAAEFAADLERWIARRPIEARPPTAGYLLRMALRRHWALSLAGALVLTSIVLGAAVATRYAISESQARREAEQRSAELDAVNRFMRDMLASAAPENARGRQVSVLDVIDSARVSLDADRSLPPGVAVQLRTTLGDTLTGLGQAAPAIIQLEAAIVTAGQAGRDQDNSTRSAHISLAAAYQFAGRNSDAEKELDLALNGLDTRTLESERLRIQAEGRRAELLLAHDGHPAAIALLRPLLAEAESRLGAADPDTLETLRRLAVALWQSGDYEGADRLQRQLLDQRVKKLGSDHPRSLDALEAVALIQREWGRYKEAEPLWREALSARRRVMGLEHITTLLTEQGLAATLWAAGRSTEPETEALARHSLEGLRQQLGEQDTNTRTAYMLLAIVLRDQKHLAEAAPLMRKVIDGLDQRRATGIDITGLNHYGQLLLQLHQPAEALAAYDQLLARLREVMGPEHPSNGIYRCNRAEALLQLGRYEAARAELEPALKQLQERMAPEHPRIKSCIARLDRARREQAPGNGH